MLSSRHVVLAGGLLLLVPLTRAQTVISWANTGGDLAQPGSWKKADGSAVTSLPTDAVAQFDSTATIQPSLMSALAVTALRIAASAGPLALTGTGTLTIGAGGLENNTTAAAQTVSVPLEFDVGTAAIITNNGSLSVTAALRNNTGGPLRLGGLGNGSVSGVISGAGPLITVDNGSWTLSGLNTYTADTQVLAGTLRLAANGTLPAGTHVSISPGASATATLDVGATQQHIGALTLGGMAGGAAMINLAPGGSLGLGGYVLYDATNAPATANINGGTLALAQSTVFEVQASVGSAFGDLMISSAITGSGLDLIKTGTGKLVLAGANSYGGSTIIKDGRLQIATGGVQPLGGAVLVDEQAVGQTAAFDLGSTAQTIGAVTLRGATNSHALVDLGPTGVLTLAGDVRYDATNNPGPAQIWNGTILHLSGANRTFNVDRSANSGPIDLMVSTPLDGSANLVKTGAGVLALAGANSYTGGTTVTNGTVFVTNSSGLGTGPVTVNGGRLAMDAGVSVANPLTVTSGVLAGIGTYRATPGSGGFVIGPGVVLAPGLGSNGTLTFDGSLITASTLLLNSDGGYHFDVADAVNAGGWDQVVVNGTVTINATPAAPFTFRLGSLSPDGVTPVVANFDPTQPYSWTLLRANSIFGFTGANQFTIDTAKFANPNGGVFSVSLNGSSLTMNFSPVPEPSMYALLLAGLGTLGVAYRRRWR